MTTQNWPDPKRPGVPMFPERDGWHWLSIGDASPIPIEWNADQSPVAFDDWGWALGDCDDDLHSPEKAAKSMRYHGPVLTPTQINEMLAAERQWCADACRAMSFDNHYTKTQRDALEEAENAIRNLGAAP